MGRSTAYWYRRGRGVLVGDGGVAFRGAEVRRVDAFAEMSDAELDAYLAGKQQDSEH